MLCKYFSFVILFSIIFLLHSCKDNDTGQTGRNYEPVQSSITREQQLRDLIKQYPDSLLLTESLIEYYSNNGSYDTAITVTNEALKRDSGNVELWDIMGTLQYQNGDTIKAIKAYETALNIYPLPEYVISLGTLYAQTKNNKALVMADALLIAGKANAKREAMFIKGLYYTYTSDKPKAIALFDSCINIDYAYMFAYREKAIALYDQGKYENAREVLTRAITIQNGFDEGYYWLGRCYEKLDSIPKAKENYQMALLYDKNFIEAKEALANLSQK